MITIMVNCPFCGKAYEVEVPADGYFRWISGELIQNALPELSAETRELLISGICPECWEGMFS